MGVVVAGIVIMFTGITWVDSAVSFIIIAVILYSSYHLLIDSVNLALDAVPENVNLQSVKQYLESIPEVLNVHDLHIWALSTTDAALTVHLSTLIQTDTAFITTIQIQLHEQFGIDHSTIQVEYGNKIEEGEYICN
jgi:cobalt-zinc-cadmium efflux system protein